MADILDLILSRYRFLSNSERLILRDAAGSGEILQAMTIDDIQAVIGRRLRIKADSIKKALSDASSAEIILDSDDIRYVFLGGQGYPSQLAEIYDAPYMIYYRGELPDWNNPAAAVVGTRLARGQGLDAAFKLGFDLAGYGLPVVSGLAMGIDSAAHSGAVAAGGCTIAVLGCGVDRVYPAVNKKLAAAILEAGGAIVSEYLPGEEPRRHNFPERNRIISGLSRAVVVVEAPGRSGALITADFALEQGRDLFFHEAGLGHSADNHTGRFERMLFDGAPVIKAAADILDDWGFSSPQIVSFSAGFDSAANTAEAGRILAARMQSELQGYSINFNGNYFRRTCCESSYSIDS